MPFAAAHKTLVHLADGRELIYFDAEAGPDPGARAAYPDTRPLDPRPGSGESRFDPLLGEWVAVAANRQVRPYHPGPDVCPFCPSTATRHTEIPAPDYEVAVFENRFPSLSSPPEPPDELIGPLPHRLRRGGGRCEVVAFTSDHDATFASLGEDRVQLILAAWTDRTANLFGLPGVQQVYVFENAGAEIGVTITHPHGQIYAFPYLTPKMSRVVQRGQAHAARTGGNLHDDVLAAELAGGRVVLQNAEWVAFVPFAARWPYEAHLYPRRRVPDFTGLDDAQRAAFPAAYLTCCAGSSGCSARTRRRSRTSRPGTRRRPPSRGRLRCTWRCSRSGGLPAGSRTWLGPSRAWAPSCRTSRRSGPRTGCGRPRQGQSLSRT